ncbi:MAG: hypothetical protein JG782_154 [Anaerophaga sp.]|nr:hypothetical protein [Anaerophaga sp.]
MNLTRVLSTYLFFKIGSIFVDNGTVSFKPSDTFISFKQKKHRIIKNLQLAETNKEINLYFLRMILNILKHSDKLRLIRKN